MRVVLGLLPAVALHLLLALPDGRLGTPSRRNIVVAGYVVGLATGLALLADRDQVRTWPLVILWALALVVGLGMANVRYRAAGAVDRRRLQWIGWALAVGAEAILVVAALEVLADWPRTRGSSPSRSPASCPLALIAGTYGRLIGRIDRVLTYTVSLAGLTALIVAIYVVVVVGLGRRPQPGPSGRSCCSRWWRPASPRCSTCRPAAGSPSGPTAWSTASGWPPTRRCGRSASGSPVPSRWTSCCCSWPSRCARAWR